MRNQAAKYRVWRVAESGAVLLGRIEASDYLEAVEAAERRYGTGIEVYLPPQTHSSAKREKAAT